MKNLCHGDLGRSIIEKRPVSELLRHHLPYSLSLGLTAIAISFVLGVSMGIISAAAKDTIIDRIAMVVALFGVTIPAFWLGLILILCFAVMLTWFPVSGSGTLSALVLPAVTVGLGGAGLICPGDKGLHAGGGVQGFHCHAPCQGAWQKSHPCCAISCATP